MFENRDLVWKAMAEADVHRRYHGKVCDELRKKNRLLVVSAWLVSVAASMLALWDAIPVEASIGLLILAAAFTTFRDILRLPDRLADSRFTLVGLNQEYDKMRVLWETEGQHYPSPEYESFLNVSRLHGVAPLWRTPFHLGEPKEVSHGWKKARAVSARVQGADRRAGEGGS